MLGNQSVKSLLAVCGAATLFLVVLWLVPHTPVPVYRYLQDGTGFLVVNFAHFLGLSAHYDSSNHYFAVAGFNMRLVEECVALHYHAILTLAVVLTPGQRWRRKMTALILFNAALVFFNVLRLVFIGVVGHEFPTMFELVHDYLWQVAFAILTVFLCMAWIQSPTKQTTSRYSVLLYSLAFSGVFAFAFNNMKITYLTVMVWLADKVILLTNFSQDWGARWWLATQNNFVMVRVNGEKVLYSLPNRYYSVNLWQEMFGLVLFWGFCAGWLCWLWRHKEPVLIVRFTLGLIVGTLLLACVHLGTVVVLGWMLVADPKMDLGSNFLWLIRGVSVLLPIVCWWLVWKRTRSSSQIDDLFVRNT